MMRTVHLHGGLSRFGDKHVISVETVGEAVRALCVNFKGFQQELKSGAWHIIRGPKDTGMSLDIDEAMALKLGSADIHFVPAVAGAKRSGGVLKTVLGIALIAASFGTASFLAAPMFGVAGATTWGGALGMMGLSLALGGLSMLLAPETEDASKDKSYTMSGPVGNGRQGAGVPLVYGEVVAPAMMISGGLDISQMKTLDVAQSLVPGELSSSGSASGKQGMFI
jgi:predicted phage tail protein